MPGLIIAHCTHVLSFYNVLHKYVQLLCQLKLCLSDSRRPVWEWGTCSILFWWKCGLLEPWEQFFRTLQTWMYWKRPRGTNTKLQRVITSSTEWVGKEVVKRDFWFLSALWFSMGNMFTHCDFVIFLKVFFDLHGLLWPSPLLPVN